MKKILWLSSWYPNKLSPFDGSFVQRHAQAVALYQPVHIICVIKDEQGVVTNDVKVEAVESGDLTEVVAYYKPVKSGIRIIDRVLSTFKYVQVYKQLIRSFIMQEGAPELIHAHIAMRAGVLALWLKRKYAISYVVTEHWSGYDEKALDNIYEKGPLFRKLTKNILKNAELLLPVSMQLGKRINERIIPIRYRVIPNVVDTRYFKFVDHTPSIFSFIHVSTMNHPKNVEGMLNCLSRLVLQDQQWRLVMVGPAGNDLQLLASGLGLDGFLEWKGEIPYEQVADEMKASSAMVLFSRYENLPCVILEAHCCGLPVIATRVGGIPELVDNDNGILVESDNEQQLLEAMMNMIKNYAHFNKSEIASNAVKKYSYEVIGKEIKQVYDELRS